MGRKTGSVGNPNDIQVDTFQIWINEKKNC